MSLYIMISLYLGPNLKRSLMQGPLYSKEILVYAANDDAAVFTCSFMHMYLKCLGRMFACASCIID